MTVKSNKNAAQGACYVAPKAVELDLRSEGVLCASGEFSISSFVHEEETLSF